MKTKALWIILFVCMAIGTTAVTAECDPATAWDTYPKLPMGCNPIHVWIDGKLADVGTYITFSGENVRDSGYLYTDELGGCGPWDPFSPKLMIQGQQSPDQCGMLNIPDGAPIIFYVNGIPAKVRINRNIDCGEWYFTYTDGEWFDTLPFSDGATYDIELMTGDIEPEPIVDPELTGPCEEYSYEWLPEDKYWIDHWTNGPTRTVTQVCNGVTTYIEEPEAKMIIDHFNSLALHWYMPEFTHEQTVEEYQRMVFFAEHGGYGCHPNLTAMVDGQGWMIMHTSYGWPYIIGDMGWTRVTTTEAVDNNLPSLFCPPLDHPVLVENGYMQLPDVPVMVKQAVMEEPTTIPTTVETTVITPTIPTLAPQTTPEVTEVITTVPTIEPPPTPDSSGYSTRFSRWVEGVFHKYKWNQWR